MGHLHGSVALAKNNGMLSEWSEDDGRCGMSEERGEESLFAD